MAKTTAIWLDTDGQPCDPVDAVTGEIVQYDDDGIELFRTYMDARPTTGDVWPTLDGRPVSTLGDLQVVLQLEGIELQVRRQRIGAFVESDLWSLAPAELVAEVYAWLESTRSK